MSRQLLLPPPATPGDRIAIVAPSSGGAATAQHILELGRNRLVDQFDLRPTVHPTARQSDAYLRAHPEARAAAIHEAFRDPDVSAVIATIGGNDQLRVLSHLRPDVLRDHPTRFFGMSDNTNLTLYLWRLGIGSFNGGQLLNQIATPGPLPDYTVRYLERALFEERLGELRPADRWADLTMGWDDPDYATADPGYRRTDGWSWRGGTDPVAGPVWGGCLAIIEWLFMADQHLPTPARLDGAILAVETAEDMPSAERVRAAFMCMGERGLLERFAGVMVGRPATQSWRDQRSWARRTEYRHDQREAIAEQVARYNPDAPVVFDVDFGHTNPTIPLPIGGRCELEPARETIRFPG